MNDIASTGPVLYFAYGANMNSDQINQRAPGAKVVGVAALDGYDLAFFGRSERWDGGLENAVRQPGATLWGVVYELSGPAFDRLDAWQGVRLDGTGDYFHSSADLRAIDGRTIAALMYRKSSLGDAVTPSAEYLDHIVAGARAHGLPADYVARLAAGASHPAAYAVPRAENSDRFLMAGGGACAC